MTARLRILWSVLLLVLQPASAFLEVLVPQPGSGTANAGYHCAQAIRG